MTTLNVLITSVSRKVWLVKLFKSAIRSLNLQGKVIGADMNPLSAGFLVTDNHYILPLSTSDSFIEAILEICKKEAIKLIIPTRDGELSFFAENKHFFEEKGIKVIVSDPQVVEICRDKYKFSQFLQQNGLLGPKTYLSNQSIFESKFPLILKPRSGSGGKGIFKINNGTELELFQSYVPNSILQEFITGKEFTIDVLSDFQGKVLTIVPRERIEVFSGESFKGKTVKDSRLLNQAKILAEKLGSVGHITIQCIVNDDNVYFIEVNPRFGGGAALSVAAGANTPVLILKLILGQEVKPLIGQYEEGLIMLRYTEDFYIKDSAEKKIK
jgi:carbamoyl-phosphate synthase large subunit